MYVRLFSALDIQTLEDEMNNFLEGRNKNDILNIDMKVTVTYNETQESTNAYYYGIVSFEGEYE